MHFNTYILIRPGNVVFPIFNYPAFHCSLRFLFLDDRNAILVGLMLLQPGDFKVWRVMCSDMPFCSTRLWRVSIGVTIAFLLVWTSLAILLLSLMARLSVPPSDIHVPAWISGCLADISLYSRWQLISWDEIPAEMSCCTCLEKPTHVKILWPPRTTLRYSHLSLAGTLGVVLNNPLFLSQIPKLVQSRSFLY